MKLKWANVIVTNFHSLEERAIESCRRRKNSLNCEHFQAADHWVCVGVWLSKIELLNAAAETSYLLAVMVRLQNFDNAWSKGKQHNLNTPVNKEPRDRATRWEADHMPGFCTWTIEVRKTGDLGIWREELVPKKRGPCQEVISERKKLEGRSWKWGIPEMREMCGDECWGSPRTLAADARDW